MTTSTKVKPPTRTQIINALLPIRREQIKKDWEAAKAECELAAKAFEDNTAEWVMQNPDVWSPHVRVCHYGTMEISCFLDDEKPENDEPGRIQLPTHLLAEYRKLEALKEKLDGLPNPNHPRDSDLKRMIREELDALDPKSLIDNTTTEKAEEMPVMKEYLEQFMQTLTKVSKARARLTATN